MKRTLASLGLCFALSCTAFASSTRDNLQDRVDAAKVVLDKIMAAGDRSIPMSIMQQATCVGVVPGLIKGAFVFGGQYGQGVVTCRTGHGWSAPVFIRMAGGSWGLQVGGQATDLEIYAKDLINTRRVLANIYVETTGQPIDKIERDMERDYHMTAPEAVAYGICDSVISRQTREASAPKPTST